LYDENFSLKKHINKLNDDLKKSRVDYETLEVINSISLILIRGILENMKRLLRRKIEDFRVNIWNQCRVQ
jgi:hypothetical protein